MRKIKTNLILLLVTIIFFGLYLNSKDLKIDEKTTLMLDLGIRGYYLNDQRIQWSGMEATFGAESFLNVSLVKKSNRNEIFASGEIRMNQRFDRNRLTDEYRSRYLQNFEIETFELTRMFVGFRGKDIELSIGKRGTNFGNDRLLHLFNSDFDLPFIRTESILLRETGIFFSYRKGLLDLSLSVVNGGPEMDTNSSKAGIVRLGLSGKNFKLGVSAKFQDGIGSEQQKTYKNHAGFDLSFKKGKLLVSGEMIYDQYGFRKDFDPDLIFWKRSLYGRDLFSGEESPVTGFGGYIDVQYRFGDSVLNVNYGEFHPEKLDIPEHDEPIRRLIIKSVIQLKKGPGIFAGLMLENERPVEPVFSGRRGYVWFAGANFNLN